MLLTTLTTVLGLLPLLYEGSNQAQFLKPTVVTLVYGLGFGMVLVLMIVPSLIAMQSDFTKQIRAARRALRRGHFAATWPAMLGAVFATVWFAVTAGPVIVTGEALPAMVTVLPILANGVGVTLGVFAAGLAVALLSIYALAGIVLAWRWRKTG